MDLYDLTSMQKSIWFTEKFYKDTPISNIAGTAMINEKVNFDFLAQAINLFIKKNDSFRLKFVLSNGIPKQYVENISSNFTFDLISVYSDEDIKKLEYQLSSDVFNILDSFLFTFKLFEFPDGHGGFVVCMHHMISDAWSSGLLVSEIMDFYANLVNNQKILEQNMPSYLDAIIDEQNYLKSNKFEKDKIFWESDFATVPPIATIPGSIEAKNFSSSSKRKQFTIPKETLSLVKTFCKENKFSEFNFFMAILSIYIYNVSNMNEFAIGTPVLNRSNYKEKHTTGMFISVVPFRISINPEQNFIDFVSSISSKFFAVFKHQKYPYDNLLTSLRNKFGAIPNLYNVVLSYQNMRNNAKTCSVPYSAKWLPNNHISEDLEIHFFDINDSGEISIAYDYKKDKYSIYDIFSLHARFLNIINQVLSNNTILLKEIEIILPDEKNKIFYEFNNTKMELPSDKNIIQLFEEQAEKNPDKIALVFEKQKLTYRELNEKSNSLAHLLKQNSLPKNDIVGIMLNRSAELVISMLAILKTGNAYMLINSTLPDDRISYMIKNSKCSLLISNNSVTSLHDCSLFDCKIIDFSCTNTNISNLNIYDAKYLSVIYTSGSTGTPKGVLVKVSSMVNLMWSYINYIHASLYNKFLSTCNISFDMFSVEVILPLILGKTLFLANEEEQKNPIQMSELILKNKVEYMLSTPSKLELLLLNENCAKSLMCIKSLQVGGESPSTYFLNKLSQFTNADIYNAYGPTETTSCCSMKKIVDNTDITIGKPLGNVQIYILNKDLNLCPVGILGEIYIAGSGISAGYIGNPGLTEKVFLKNPFNEGLLYRTGDLAYYTKNYEIKFIGRNDSQVKINGLRIELSEIDSVICSYPDIEKACTIYNSKLIAYFKSSKSIDTSLLKDFAKSKLPAYMVPSALIQIDEFPLSPNGKVDIKKLPAISSIEKNSNIVAPRNEKEKQLFDIFASILQNRSFGIYDDFFELGGDSLAAIKLSVEIYGIFNINVSVKEIFENTSIAKLAVLLNKTNAENTTTIIPKLQNKTCYPLSSAQKRIYYASNLSGESSILYNMPGGVLFDKMPDVNKLENALQILVERHEALRTFFEVANNTITQKVKDNITFELKVSNKVILENEIEDTVKKFIKPFDLSQAPLFRCEIIKIENGKALFLIDTHHIISDGTSSAIFIEELCKLYNGQTLEKNNVSYKDFANFENEKIENGEFEEAKEFWINQFSNDVPVLNMSTSFPRPSIKSYEGAKFNFILDETITEKINKVSKECGITPYMLLLSAYYILLSKYSSQEDIIIGSPIVGRNSAELYNVFGVFVNTLPMRANIDYSKTFQEFAHSVKNICLDNYKYQDYPLDELVSKLNLQRDTSRNPLFDTLFVYQNNGIVNFSFDGINSTYYIPDTKISKFDLSLEVVPDNNVLNLNFEYCTKLFSKTFIKELSSCYSNIVTTVVDNMKIPLKTISVLSEKEKKKLLYTFNNTSADYPKDKTFVQLFENQVNLTPNNIAVVFGNTQLTYIELNKKANSLAHFLKNNGISRNDIVGIMVNRSLEMIISMLAVLKAGATYVPIDPDYPKDRIEYMLDNSNAKLLLTQTSLQETLSFNNKVLVDLEIDYIYNTMPDCNLECFNNPEDPIYVIYTSGSTGLPKGVILQHKNIINFIYGIINKLHFTTSNTIVSVTTNSFDIFVLESLLPLLNGMKIVIASKEAQTDINLLNELCVANNVDIIQTTPSRMQALIFNGSSLPFIKNMKHILIGGEPFPSKLLSNLNSLTTAKIYNMYGPTETAVWSSLKELTSCDNITIGKPIANTQFYILDKFGLPLPVGVAGELYISGDGVGKGYLNNEDQTKKSFIKNPFIDNSIMYKTGDLCRALANGEIEYLERIDNQVKIRGLRIELGEIEEKILSFPNIKKACVIKQSLHNRDFISAYFTITKKISISELRNYLLEFLPKYMVPSYFTVLEDFAYTPNGKIDKKVLPLPKEILNNTNEKSYVAPKTDLELKMVSIWEMILNTSPIGITDDFFELGGDSILAMNLNIELLKITDKISYADIFKFPTISKLIEKINSSNKEFTINYMEKQYFKYDEVLKNNKTTPNIFNLKHRSCNNVLLTGATGFLGIHILDSFLKNEEGKIYCIVRPEAGITAQTKLYQKLNYYFGSKYDKLIGSRIFAISGNISAPGFGLSHEDLLNLATNTDIVINSAARVSHYGVYADFYNSNVKSVKYMIDFCKNFNKKLYQISTLSISGNSFDAASTKQNLMEKTNFEENNLYIGQSLDNVYINSKFEAECLVLDAILDGLDAYILRMGNLMPRFCDGVFQENVLENAYINRILAFTKLGGIPDYLKNGYLEFTPIDSAANAIIKLITHSNKNNRIFHLFNHNHLSIDKFIKNLKTLNPNFKILSDDDFKNKIKNNLNNKNLINSLINDFDKNLQLMYKTDIIIKSDFTIKYLSKIGFSWPKISEKYITNFLNLLKGVL